MVERLLDFFPFGNAMRNFLYFLMFDTALWINICQLVYWLSIYNVYLFWWVSYYVILIYHSDVLFNSFVLPRNYQQQKWILHQIQHQSFFTINWPLQIKKNKPKKNKIKNIKNSTNQFLKNIYTNFVTKYLNLFVSCHNNFNTILNQT